MKMVWHMRNRPTKQQQQQQQKLIIIIILKKSSLLNKNDLSTILIQLVFMFCIFENNWFRIRE